MGRDAKLVGVLSTSERRGRQDERAWLWTRQLRMWWNYAKAVTSSSSEVSRGVLEIRNSRSCRNEEVICHDLLVERCRCLQGELAARDRAVDPADADLLAE